MHSSTTVRSVMELADLATPMAVRVAATLNLVEHAEGPGATVKQLADKTATKADGLQRLLDHLAAVGVSTWMSLPADTVPPAWAPKWHKTPRGCQAPAGHHLRGWPRRTRLRRPAHDNHQRRTRLRT
jgi:hypothetical protein